jgi:hypothetical protein
MFFLIIFAGFFDIMGSYGSGAIKGIGTADWKKTSLAFTGEVVSKVLSGNADNVPSGTTCTFDQSKPSALRAAGL